MHVLSMEEAEAAASKRRKRKISGEEDQSPEKLPAISLGSEEDDNTEKLEIDEEAVVEVMQWLEKEITSPSSSSSTSAGGGGGGGYFYQAPAFIAINENEEVCGPSFSDSCSVMVGVSFSTAQTAAPAAVKGWDEWLALSLGRPDHEMEMEML